MTVRIYLSLKN